MTVVTRTPGGRRPVAEADALGASVFVVLVTVIGGVGLGLAVVNLLGHLRLPGDADAATVRQKAFPR